MSQAVATPRQMARAAAKRVEQLPTAATSRVSVPMVERQNAQGLPELVHAETGVVMGICASATVAKTTREFLQ